MELLIFIYYIFGMENNIDFSEGKVTSLNKWFFGTYKDENGEYGYTLMTNWDDWDEWTVDEVSWDDESPENENEVVEMITKQFKDYMYS